jgi:hypothetical protein
MQFLSQRAENKVHYQRESACSVFFNVSQVLQEELAKFKQQSEKARVQKLQQVRA